MPVKLELYGLSLPEVQVGDDLAALLAASARDACGGLQEGDVLVVASKIVSKARGYLVRLDEVEPSPRARGWRSARGWTPGSSRWCFASRRRCCWPCPWPS